MNAPAIISSIGHGALRLGAWAGGFFGGGSFYDATNNSPDRRSIDSRPRDSILTLTPLTRREMSGAARKLRANVGFVRGAIADIARYSVGNGVYPWSAVPDKAVADAHDEYLDQWWGIPEVRQMWSMTELQLMMSMAIDTDGDIGHVLTETVTGYPQIQVVESHRIQTQPGGEMDSYDGVQVNGLGRPTAYTVRVRKDLIGVDDQWLTIPASSFILAFDPDRVDGLRGASGLSHAINDIIDKQDILGFEKIGVKLNSSIGAVIETASGVQQDMDFLGPSKKQTNSDGTEVTLEKIRGGAMPKLPPGAKLNSFESSRPSPTFTGFLSYIDRGVAAGLGVPVEVIWDPASVGGAGQRFVLVKFHRRCLERRATIKKHTLRIRNYVIAKGIKRGDIPPHPLWWSVHWQEPPSITVDAGREATANREDYWSGLRTMQEDYGERGIDWKHARADMQEAADDLCARAVVLEQKYKAQGLTFDKALLLLESRSKQGVVHGANSADPQLDPAPAKGSTP